MPNGLRNCLSHLPYEIKAIFKHQRGVRQAKKYRGSLVKLHLGSGSNLIPGYLNVDLDFKQCLQLDLREKLPFQEKSVSHIYSEHLWEHLLDQYAKQLFQECFRVLTAGGHFSVGVPDGEQSLKSYSAQLPVRNFKLADFEDLPFNPTRMQLVNQLFRRFGHHYIYDFETMAKMLKDAGFVNIQRRSFNPEIDSEHRREWTLYVDAYKPE